MSTFEKPNSQQDRTSVTSLIALSNYVKMKFPEVLAENPSQLHTDAELLTRNLGFARNEPHSLPQNLRRQVLLDLKMLEIAIIQSKLEVPKDLADLVDALADVYEIRGLTYQDIVMTNTDPTLLPRMIQKNIVALPGQRKIRTFTTGDVGKTEAQFYMHHAKIENILGRVIKTVREVINSLQLGERHNIPTLLPIIRVDLNSVVRLTSQLRKMPEGHFGMFRKFLGSNGVRRTKGPSGAFTAKVPTLEVLLRGESGLEESYRRSLVDNEYYFPTTDREGLTAACQGTSLSDMYEKNRNQPEVLELIQLLDKFFLSFRKVHYRVVERQVPEAVLGTVAGTGGETDVAGFLQKRIDQPKPWIREV